MSGYNASAQLRVNVNLNIGSQPEWGPSGYSHAEYYYMPDIDAYYYVPSRQFIYLENGRWIFAASLPSRYGYYNLYTGYKVVINEPRPYLRNDVYRVRYQRYRGWNGHQRVNRDYDRYRREHDNGNDRDDRRGNDRGRGNGHNNGRGNGHGHH